MTSVRRVVRRRGFDVTFVMSALSQWATEIAPTYGSDQKYIAILSIAVSA